MTWTQRLQLESLLKSKTPVKEICKILGVSNSTIYREIKRGAYERLNGATWEHYTAYSPDIAHEKYLVNLSGKGAPLKIGKDFEFADYIERRIGQDKMSPCAVLGEIRHKNIKFGTSICPSTLYSYIANGVFLTLSLEDLPYKPTRKRRKRKVVASRPPRGTSIEKRPKEIADRNTFGHWEMDTVKGKQGVTKSCMLVLTERKTRDEIIFKLKDQKAESVVDALDRLERKWGDMFSKVFRSITVDNGVEFSDCKGMERSALTPGEKRTYLFYCHPCSSYERGTNENTNKLIRRHIPKGEDFDEKQDRDIEFIENWINTYPRGIFGFRTSEELFKEELEKITA